MQHGDQGTGQQRQEQVPIGPSKAAAARLVDSGAAHDDDQDKPLSIGTNITPPRSSSS
jgi:hypothetical protein